MVWNFQMSWHEILWALYLESKSIMVVSNCYNLHSMNFLFCSMYIYRTLACYVWSCCASQRIQRNTCNDFKLYYWWYDFLLNVKQIVRGFSEGSGIYVAQLSHWYIGSCIGWHLFRHTQESTVLFWSYIKTWNYSLVYFCSLITHDCTWAFGL